MARYGIVADFLFEGGSEAVVEEICATFPDCEVYTAIYDPAEISRYPSLDLAWREGRLHASAAQALFRWPALLRHLSVYHFYWLYFLTTALQKTQKHEVVIVSCAAQSKLTHIAPGARVIVYFHTPTRWLYRGLVTKADLAAIPPLLRPAFAVLNTLLRPLDRLGIRRLRRHDPVWLCNSSYTREMLQKTYGVDCEVLYPPVEVRGFDWTRRQPGDFFLYHGRLSFQKRVDVAIEGCLLARRKLVISGRSVTPEVQRHLEGVVVAAVSRDPSLAGLVTFLGRTSDDELGELFATCRALVFPPREDFGITPLEAMASGTPVIAYGAGGALDYVQPDVNGVFFAEQTGEALATAIAGFDDKAFDPETVARSVVAFTSDRFGAEIRSIAEGSRRIEIHDNPSENEETA